MAFLLINGVTVKAELSPDEAHGRIGEEGRAWSGARVGTVRARKRAWRFRTPPLLPAEAKALVRLLEGRGHNWGFEDTTNWKYSNGKGLGSSAESASGVSRSTANPKYENAHVRIALNTPVDWIEWPTDLVDVDGVLKWTAIVWRDDGGGYDHYIETSDGRYYLDGVAASQEAWFSVASDGTFRLQGDTGVQMDFDELVVLPFEVPASWVPGIYDFHNGTTPVRTAAVWLNLPQIGAFGDFVEESGLVVESEEVTSPYEAGVISGSFQNAARRVQFTLVDV